MLNMKTAKSFKIILSITAIAMFICAMLCQFTPTAVKAAGSLTPSSYFTFSAEEDGTFDYVDNLSADYQVNGSAVTEGVLASVKEGDEISLKNKVVVDDLGVKIIADKKIKKFAVVIKGASYDVNGNRTTDANGDVVFDKTISTEYEVSQHNGNVTLEFGLLDGYVAVATSAGGTKRCVEDSTNSYYKLRHVDKTPVELSFKIIEVEGGSAVDFVITDINQKASEGYAATNKFNQTFNLNDTKDLVTVSAYPMVAIEDNFFTNTQADEYVIKKLDGNLYTFTVTGYSVMNVIRSSSMFLKAGTFDDNGYGMTISTESNSKRIIFNLQPDAEESSLMEFHVAMKEADVDVVLDTYEVEVLPSNVSNEAPKYKDIDEVRNQVESFQKALDLASQKDGHSINLGEKIFVPSLENFITDDYSSYNKLTKTIHLVTPSNEDKTTTSSSIQLDEIGVYKLYVTFKDENGASMDKEDFFSTDLDAEPKYKDFVFTITINDDAELLVKPESQEDGFVGVIYKATPFDITASGYKTEYKLFYNPSLTADKDAGGWTEIRTLKNYNSNPEGDYSLEELTKIAYDGKLTFKPDKVGSYKIQCYVYSDKSYRDATESTVIRIIDNPIPVKPANNWLKENVWSVVFLSVGTLCLAGIIVLLCIKPKDSADKE